MAKMKFIIFLLCLTAHSSFSEKVRYDGYKLFKVIPKTYEAVRALHELEEAALSGYNFWSSVGLIGDPVEVMVPSYKVSEVQQLATKMGMDYEVMMENVQDYVDRPETCSDDEVFGWECYHTLDQVCFYILQIC